MPKDLKSVTIGGKSSTEHKKHLAAREAGSLSRHLDLNTQDIKGTIENRDNREDPSTDHTLFFMLYGDIP